MGGADRLTLDAHRTAVLVIDLQQEFFDADAELERCRPGLVAATNRLVTRALDAGCRVVEVRTVHPTDGSTWTLRMRDTGSAVLVEGTRGVERLPELAPIPEQLTKTRDSAFHGTDLADRLRSTGVRHLVLAGVSTESCIDATATDAYAHDLRVVLARDATASVDPAQHDRSLAELARKYDQPAPAVDEVELVGRCEAGDSLAP